MEVVTALPINGGAYTALLNTTGKRAASAAACLSLLSYVATAVIGAYSAVQYIAPIWPAAGGATASTIGTIAILAFFAILTLCGVGESSAVAVAMFSLHVAALCVLVAMTALYVAQVSDRGWRVSL